MHFGTGNYNESTARLYSDVSLFTCDEQLGTDAVHFFNAITGLSVPQSLGKLAAAPINLRESLLELIQIETESAARHGGGQITAKVNSLADQEVIDALYTAPVAALSYQWFGLANHMTELKVLKLIGATVVTDKTWNRISPEARDEVVAAAVEAGDNAREKIRDFEDEAISVMQEHGLVIHSVTEEQAAVWEASARRSWVVYTDSNVPAELVVRVEALRDEYRKQQANAN